MIKEPFGAAFTGTGAPGVRWWRISVLSAWVAALCVTAAYPQSPAALPRLQKQGTATQLVVRGKPFLMLGGSWGIQARQT